MTFAMADGLAHRGSSFLLDPVGLQKADMCGPRHIYEQSETLLSRQIQKPFGWHIIDAQQIGPQFADLLEVADNLSRGAKGFALCVRSERPIRDAFDAKLPLPEPEEFSINGNALGGCAREGLGHGGTAS